MTALMDAPPAGATRTVTVLLVDDTPTLRMLTRLSLEGTGFDVIGEAGDGLAGLNLAKQLRPDLILLDLAMPVMDGLEALPLMRLAVPEAKVVVVSGFDRHAMESQVLAAGAHAYLQKGLAPAVTLEILRGIFPEHPVKDRSSQVPALPAPRAELVPDAAERSSRAAELEEELEQLLYVISHDLSEPVHVIKGFATRLARRSHSDEEGEFCEFISSAADRMQQLLDDLLDYARSSRGDLPQELLDCRRLVDNVIAGVGSILTASGGRVTIGDLPRDLVASRLVLTQVLHNLVTNAVKFTRPGVSPQVRVEARTTPECVTFRVADNGLGIPPEQFERIFEPFKRLHSRDRYPGSGIGLAICRRLVHRHGGRIWVESSETGSTFVFEVPR